MNGALVRWNQNIESLKSSNFPTNQPLDFLPDNQVEWQYEAKSRTPVGLSHAHGHHRHLSNWKQREIRPAISSTRCQAWCPYSLQRLWKPDTPFGRTGEAQLAIDEDTGLLRNYQPLHLILGAVHLHNVPRAENTLTNFEVGPIESASYSTANCNITRAKGRTNDDLDLDVVQQIAFPWTLDAGSTVSAFTDFHQAGTAEQSFNGEPIYLPSGEEMFRFYQAYMISKDTQYKQTVTRSISVKVPSVELSVVALALILLYVVVMAVVLLWAGLIMRVSKGMWVPRTKVEWMMQGIREVGGREVDAGLWEVGWDGLGRGLRGAVLGKGAGAMGGTSMNIQLGQDVERPSIVQALRGKL
ncbi:hypothetical protein DL95DRAFT_462241 [Leptodontidium sp. 2 PMI_412]|nr:hypothetical protein DL95DRAFT_462241 [Leptodontidium sp. 2 PMI_412]